MNGNEAVSLDNNILIPIFSYCKISNGPKGRHVINSLCVLTGGLYYSCVHYPGDKSTSDSLVLLSLDCLWVEKCVIVLITCAGDIPRGHTALGWLEDSMSSSDLGSGLTRLLRKQRIRTVALQYRLTLSEQ